LRQIDGASTLSVREIWVPSLTDDRESCEFLSSKYRLISYVSETNVVAKVIDSTINQTPYIALDKPVEMNRTFIFHSFLETTP
jgi:hypothetical protein